MARKKEVKISFTKEQEDLHTAAITECEEEDGPGRFDVENEYIRMSEHAEAPDPYAPIDAVSPELTEILTYHLGRLITSLIMDSEGKEKESKDFDMRFQMQCPECKWGPCNTTQGFTNAPCHSGENARKDGFYVGDFPGLRNNGSGRK